MAPCRDGRRDGRRAGGAPGQPRAGGAPGQPRAGGAPGQHSDADWLHAAIELSRRCPATDSAFCVGAILVADSGRIIAQRYSRQSDPRDHAEEAALADAAASGADLRGATLYTSLEPCLRRVSRPAPCAELILRNGLRRVVYAWREPPLFQPGGGAAWLEDHGVTVIELPDLASAARAVNEPLLLRRDSPAGW